MSGAGGVQAGSDGDLDDAKGRAEVPRRFSLHARRRADETAEGDSVAIVFDDEDNDEDDASELEGPDLLDTETAAREA